MKIILTGGNGFLGKFLYNKLIENNHNVFCYDIVDGYDILDINKLENIFQQFKPESIIHLAACADLNIFSEKPEVSYNINVVGTKNILNLCNKYNCRLLFASTCCCYGNNNTHPSDEDSPTCPTEPYAHSKKESEKDILEIGLPHCCMRLATFYGPAMRPALAPAIFLDKIHKNETIEIHGTGNQTRTMTYVDDIVNGICVILETEPKYTIINVTTEEIVSVLDIIKYSEEIIGKNSNYKYVLDRKGQILEEVIHSKRLQSLGWRPLTTFKDGLIKSYEYYKNNNFKW